GRGRGRGHQVEDSSDSYEPEDWYRPNQPVTVRATERPRRAAAVTAARCIARTLNAGIKDKPMSPANVGGGGGSCSGKRSSSETSSTSNCDDSSCSGGNSESKAPGSEELAEQVAWPETENDNGDLEDYEMEVDEPGQAASDWWSGEVRSLPPRKGLIQAARDATASMTISSDEADTGSSEDTSNGRTGRTAGGTRASSSADAHTGDGAGAPVHSRAETDMETKTSDGGLGDDEDGDTDMDGDDERSDAGGSDDEEDEGEQLLSAIRAAAGRKQQQRQRH
ncbi:hypothetical protein Vretimale_15620, partial [Volvox reticuliferus]